MVMAWGCSCVCVCVNLRGRVWIYSSLPCMGKPPMVVVTVQGAPPVTVDLGSVTVIKQLSSRGPRGNSLLHNTICWVIGVVGWCPLPLELTSASAALAEVELTPLCRQIRAFNRQLKAVGCFSVRTMPEVEAFWAAQLLNTCCMESDRHHVPGTGAI